MTQQEAYKILGITEEEIEAAGAVPEGKEAAGASTETSQSFDNAFQNFNRQAVERLIKKKYRQRILSAHPDVQPEEETEYSAQLLNYAYAYLKKNGWYDGHVSKKSYQVKSRASKTQVWDAPVNLRAWREREIYSYAEDSEGEKIGYFKNAAGKYIWKTEEDFSLEGNLRPQSLDEYIGQQKTKDTLKIYIEAAKQRHDSLDHVLFYGPPGLGKTTLSAIIANEMGTHMKVTSGPAIEKPGEMAAILNNLQEGDVLFVDEIHRLNRQVEEVLYPAMEDFAIDIMIGKGASARSIRLDLPKFTLVGATTRAGLLSAPLRDRFGVTQRLEFYDKKELTTIILRSAQVLGVEIEPNGAAEIAKRSRGTPRLANRLLKRVRDFAQVKYNGVITYDVACFALDLLEVDQYGLDKTDRRILQTLILNFQGGPVGLETLAASIGEDSGTLEDVYEPYLLQTGFLNRTPRGRMASVLAYTHLGYPRPDLSTK